MCFGNAFGQYQQEDGLVYESPDSANKTNPEYFNRDNIIYTPGREFLFSYFIIKDNDTLFCRVDKKGDFKTKNWSLVKPNNVDSLTIKFTGFKVQHGYGGMDNLFPDYSQTIIQQLYYSADTTLLFDGSTGLIENPRNIWIHPFRGKYFSVTELSPFPYIKLPAKSNNWTWKLKDIDDRWSDPRIIEYKGKQNGEYNYNTNGRQKIKTPFGKLTCYVTDATAVTGLGRTKLRSHFNSTFGFVKLRYYNIDKSIIEFNLVKVK